MTVIWASVTVAATSVFTCAGAVLLLAFRVGKLTGQYDARLQSGETDRSRIWESIGTLTGRLDHHIESAHRGMR